jgi:hypothetical protein
VSETLKLDGFDPSGVNPSYASGLAFGVGAAGGGSGSHFARAGPAVVVAGAALSLTRRARGPLLQGDSAAEPSGVAPSYWSGVAFGVDLAAGPSGSHFARAGPAVVVAGAALALRRRAAGPPLQGDSAAEPSGVAPSYWSGVAFGVRLAGPAAPTLPGQGQRWLLRGRP